jgi:hypothetical protein
VDSCCYDDLATAAAIIFFCFSNNELGHFELCRAVVPLQPVLKLFDPIEFVYDNEGYFVLLFVTLLVLKEVT